MSTAALVLALAMVVAGTAATAQSGRFASATVVAARFFSELGHNVSDITGTLDSGDAYQADFLRSFDRTGGTERWGFPTSEILEESDGVLTQYFQRGVLDFRPEKGVQRRLAWDHLGGGLGGSEDQGVEPGLTNPNSGDAQGPWGHKVSDQSVAGVETGFKDFFDRLGGITAFGLPKTDARPDTHADAVLHAPGKPKDDRIRQYFQSAVLEFHPESAIAPVKLGLLGDTLRDRLYPSDSWQLAVAFQVAEPFAAGQSIIVALPPPPPPAPPEPTPTPVPTAPPTPPPAPAPTPVPASVLPTRQLRELKKHTGAVMSLAFSPDGQTLASGSADSTVVLWDPSTGAEKLVLHRIAGGHNKTVSSVAFSPDGRMLATGSYDKTVRLWDLATSQPIIVEQGSSTIWSVAFSPDGRFLASAGSDGTIRLWDPVTGAAFATMGQRPFITSLAFSPDGRLLAAASIDGVIRLWDPNTGAEVRALQGHTEQVNSVAFSPDGRLLASGSLDRSVRLWDPATGAALSSMVGPTSASVDSVVFSPDGRLLFSADWGGAVHVWNAATSMELRTLKKHTRRVGSLAYSPDGQLLASGSFDLTVRLWTK